MKHLERLVLSGLVLSGSACAADLTTAAHPQPNAPAFNTEVTGGSGGDQGDTQWPVFASEEEARAAMGEARLLWMSPVAQFSGNTAQASSAMRYDGNWAQMSMRLSARNSKSEDSESVAPEEASFWVQYNRYFQSGKAIEVGLLGPACGGVATNTTQFHVKHVFVLEDVKYIPTTLDEKLLPASHTERQIECPPEDCPAGYSGGDGAQWSSYWLGNAWDCEQEKEEPAGGSGGSGPCAECIAEPSEPTYCRVRYSWWKDTGEIFRWEVLWCA